jgi:uncharacterized membrane protein YhfC
MGLLAGLGMTLVGLGFLIFSRMRRLEWFDLGVGAMTWVVAVFLKFIFSVLFNGTVYQNLLGSATLLSFQGLVFVVYFGCLTGIFEVLLVYLFVRFSKVDETEWKTALAFGIGFGGVEALVFGVSSFMGVVSAIFGANGLSLSALESMSLSNNPLFYTAPISERFFTVLIHICATLLIFYAVYRNQQKWMWLAFVYKTLIDALGAYAQFAGLTTSLGALWMVEAVVMVFGILGWIGSARILKIYRQDEAEAALHKKPDIEPIFHKL